MKGDPPASGSYFGWVCADAHGDYGENQARLLAVRQLAHLGELQFAANSEVACDTNTRHSKHHTQISGMIAGG